MDPVTLIVTALVAGAAAGLKDAASSAIKDAYNGLKGLVRRKLADHPDGELVLDRHGQDPQVWEKPLAQELTAAGAGDDPALVSAAQALMQLVDAAGSAAGMYQVSAGYAHQRLGWGDRSWGDSRKRDPAGPYTAGFDAGGAAPGTVEQGSGSVFADRGGVGVGTPEYRQRPELSSLPVQLGARPALVGRAGDPVRSSSR